MAVVPSKSVNSLRLVKVAFVYPEGQHFDGICVETGDYIHSIMVASPYAGTDFGFTTGIPAPEREGWEENKKTDPDKRDIYAVVAYTHGGMPICIGYTFPQITHMAFTKAKDKNRLIERHTSDFVRTISDEADMDMVHPAGAYLRIGKGDFPDSLGGRDFDHRFQIKRNKDHDIEIMVRVGNTFIRVQNGKITLQAGSTSVVLDQQKITNTSGLIIEDTQVHQTTGQHTDSVGHHTSD